MISRLPIVGVMGAHDTPWNDIAEPLGAGLAHLNVHLLTGGGEGVMTSVARGFTNTAPRKGLSLGMIPTEKMDDGQFIAKSAYPNAYIEIPIIVPLPIYAGTDLSIINRNHVNILSADIILALPGNGGTRNEITLAMNFKKTIALLGPHQLPENFHAPDLHFHTVDQALSWVAEKIKEREEMK